MTAMCQCGHPRYDRNADERGHARGEGCCLACLACERKQGPHVLELCGCQEFEPVELVPRAQAVAQGGVPCICEHYPSSHDPRELGGRCRARHGDGTRCDCPGYEPDPRYIEEED
ncbi:hypothetical protein SEA_CRACKLEWINK_83 [Mycobacterium phage Cracklewink]|nr:hypothetical protein SEA_CRACKLEWINK_83 [Mycobacterium phage Cracklewink]